MNPASQEVLRKQKAAEKKRRRRERLKNVPELRAKQAAYEREKYLKRKEKINSDPAMKAKLTLYYREAKRRQRGSVIAQKVVSSVMGCCRNAQRLTKII
jgi:hypothetical protein